MTSAESSQAVQMLQSRMDSMQESFASLLSETDRLRRVNAGLERDNLRLRDCVEEHTSRRAWRNFHVIEQHYKGLEKHRRRLSGISTCSTPTGDADSLAGAGASAATESNVSSPTGAAGEDKAAFFAEGVQSRSMATPRIERTSQSSTPLHSYRDFIRPESTLSPVPQSPDVDFSKAPLGERGLGHSPTESLKRRLDVPQLHLTGDGPGSAAGKFCTTPSRDGNGGVRALFGEQAEVSTHLER